MSEAIKTRQAALDLLAGVLEERRLLADVLADAKGPLAALPPASRARAQRLATETLRNISRADRLLGPHLRKRPPLPVHNILRLALTEIYVDGAAAHGVVHSAVSLARAVATPMAGLVNAVLRRASAQPPEAWAKLPPQDLPKWLRRQLIDTYGKPAVLAMEQAHQAGAPVDLTLRAPNPDLAAALGAEVLPTGSLRLPARIQLSDLPGYEAGAWWVQDAAAAIPAQLLAPVPGERVLDMCAAPGGKTMQLAAAGAEVTALDISARRMGRMEQNLARTGLPAQLVVGDALECAPEAPFDAVLLDAPCSATGTIRRHPDLPFVKAEDDLPSLLALQAAMIDRAVELVRPGGRLVYCTCSLLPAEGEAQVQAALARHPGLEVLPAVVPGVDAAWAAEGGLRLRPDFWTERGGMDGFFMALLRKG